MTPTVRINRFAPFAGLHDDFNRLLNEWLPGPIEGGAPAINLWQVDHDYFLEAELPGVSEADLEISVAGRDVTISGQRKTHHEEGTRVHLRERSAGNFSRTLRLPAAIAADQVEATLNSGVLLLKLPEAAESRPRKIKVNG